jgi:hypothetical protein
VDAIPPATLRQLCEECIVQHIDVDTYNRMQRVEEAERETLQGMIDRMEVSSR